VAPVPGTTPEAFGEDTPFLLIARIKCKKGKKAEYLKIAAVADNGVHHLSPASRFGCEVAARGTTRPAAA